jgi:hypothetical protein
VWREVLLAYVLAGAAATAFVARRTGRDTAVWFVVGLAGGVIALGLAVLAPRAGRSWRWRTAVVIAIFALLALGVVLLAVAISTAHFTY